MIGKAFNPIDHLDRTLIPKPTCDQSGDGFTDQIPHSIIDRLFGRGH